LSFLTDLFEGKTSNLGSDLNPSNIFSDTTKDIGGKYTLEESLAIPAAIATIATAGADLPGLFAAGSADVGVTAAADTGFDLATLGPGTLDASAVGADAATAAGTGLDLSALGLTADGTSAFATDPGLAAINAAAPLGTTAGAATDATAGTLSVPGIADSSVAAGDITNVANAGASSTPSFLQSLETGAVNSITKNPLGILVAGGALGYDVLKGNQTDPNAKQLAAEAPGLEAQGAGLTASGQQLTSYLQNGTLPPGQQAQVTEAVQAAKARIIANHAANGENTNPTQNSALAQELSQADLNGLALAGQLETQLAQTGTTLISAGLNETGLSSEIYQALVKIDQTNNNQLMSAIASMAAALGGGTKISIGGANATLTA
jgi:hypothetical protein